MASVNHSSQSQTPKPFLPQTAVLDEPDTLDTDDVPVVPNEDHFESSEDSDGSVVEILDGGSDVDIYEESELAKFSKMLFDAQKKALTEEKAKGKKRKAYTGHSQSTAYRQKRFRTSLAAKGFPTLDGFAKWVKSKKKQETC
jgi:hypothetical protein